MAFIPDSFINARRLALMWGVILLVSLPILAMAAPGTDRSWHDFATDLAPEHRLSSATARFMDTHANNHRRALLHPFTDS